MNVRRLNQVALQGRLEYVTRPTSMAPLVGFLHVDGARGGRFLLHLPDAIDLPDLPAWVFVSGCLARDETATGCVVAVRGLQVLRPGMYGVEAPDGPDGAEDVDPSGVPMTHAEVAQRAVANPRPGEAQDNLERMALFLPEILRGRRWWPSWRVEPFDADDERVAVHKALQEVRANHLGRLLEAGRLQVPRHVQQATMREELRQRQVDANRLTLEEVNQRRRAAGFPNLPTLTGIDRGTAEPSHSGPRGRPPCIRCGELSEELHRAGPADVETHRANTALREGDAVPVCRTCHVELHRHAAEEADTRSASREEVRAISCAAGIDDGRYGPLHGLTQEQLADERPGREAMARRLRQLARHYVRTAPLFSGRRPGG